MVSVDALWSGGRGSFPGELAIFTVLQVSVFLRILAAVGFYIAVGIEGWFNR